MNKNINIVYTMVEPNKDINFINFGCWNNMNNLKKNTENKESPVLIDIIDEIEKEQEIDFFIINGDNYYKKKEKKDKKDKSEKKEKKDKSETDIDQSQLREGFELLKKMVKGRELYLLLGNHDIKYINGKCETSILEKEIATTDEYNFPNNLTMFKEIDNTLIIMIDTNIYDGENPQCYKEIFGENKKFNDTILFNKVILNEIDKIDEIDEIDEHIRIFTFYLLI